jgi:nicotinamide riboside kinase
MKKIAWIGAHSSGKTTTVNRISRLFHDLGQVHILIPEVARLCPFKIGKNGGYDTQMWILNEQVRREKEAQVGMRSWEAANNGRGYVLCDRTVWDSLVYSTSLMKRGQMTDDEVRMVDTIVTNHAKNEPYDLIYFCEPKPLYEDGKRDTDPEWQQDIYKTFKAIIKERGINVTMVQ